MALCGQPPCPWADECASCLGLQPQPSPGQAVPDEEEKLTGDQQFSAAGIGVMVVTTGANVDPGIGGLDAGEVELGAWWGTTGARRCRRTLLPSPGPVAPWPLGGSRGRGHGYLDVAAACYWAGAAHPRETSRSSGVGSR